MKRFLRPALLLFAVVAASSRCGFDFGLLAQRGGQFFFILKKMFPPDWGFCPR